MVFVNEWLPNPAGSDVEGEWVELWNDGNTEISLDGWRLATKGGKSFSLSGKDIAPEGFFVLHRKETKLTLHNQDGELALYDAGGKLIQEASFLGSAPEGKSFSHQGGGIFIFTEPTLGAHNAVAGVEIIKNTYPLGEPLNPSVGSGGILGMAIGTGLVLAGLVMIVLLRNEDLSKLLFGGD